MNYSGFRSTYSSAKQNMTSVDSMTSRADYNLKTNMVTEPAFLNYQEDHHRTQKYKKPTENAITATKGIFNTVLCGSEKEENDAMHPVVILFFSPENMRRIQRLIKREVFARTNGQFRLDDDQDESDLIVAMRATLFDMYGGRYLPFKINHQVKELNKKTVNYIMPDLISEMKQAYGYLKEINQPLQTIMRPLNVNNAGRRTLPSITTVWGV